MNMDPMTAALGGSSVPIATAPDGVSESGMLREQPVPEQARANYVSQWRERILSAKKFHDKTFKKMRADMDFAGGEQWIAQAENDERYVANFVQRHVQQRTASLYAKNPRFYYKPKRKLHFKVWDGRQETLQAAISGVMQQQQLLQANPQMAADPMAIQMGMAMVQPHLDLLADVDEGQKRQQMLAKIGKTLEIFVEHEIDEQKPPFKKQMKQLIRRTAICKVGFVKLGFERVTDRRPEDTEKVRDYSQRIAVLDRLIADAQDGKCEQESAEREQLKIMLADAQEGPEQVIREGLVFDFCPSTSIIIDQKCRQLQGFIGAGWIAQEFQLSGDDIKDTYGVDLVSAGATTYVTGTGQDTDPERRSEKDLFAVWEIQDKATGKVFTIADGYPDFLKEPSPPEVQLERFWTLFALTFNDLENDRQIYPPSDVELQRHQQLEWNRSREGLREHRIAARPAMVSSAALTEDDKEKLEQHPAHAVIELEALQGQKIDDVLQQLKKPNIDPNLYVTDHLSADRQLVTGSSDANLGMVNDATATANSITEGGRQTSVGSNVDDLDDFLSELGKAMGHVVLMNVSAEVVTEVVGPGAVWPELSRQEIAKDLYLDAEAGSSGRPNRAAEIANFKELAPTLIQIPGISPMWLAKQAIRRLDDKVDLEEALLEGMPPISALAQAMMPPGGPGGQTPEGGGATVTGDAGNDPSNQGGAGANNAPKPPGSEIPGPSTDPMASVREPFRSNMAPDGARG